MANGEPCKHCDQQETSHDLGEDGACDNFESEVEHLEECPVLDCNGDCEETIRLRENEVKSQPWNKSGFMKKAGDY